MGSTFLNSLNLLFSIDSGANETTIEECHESVNHYTFYQFTLIPAVLITLMFAVTRRRRNILLNVLSGRPGLIYPMDMLTRSSRISYACSFGATAVLVYKIVLEQTSAIQYEGDAAVKSIIAIVSMFIYGMVFLPLFTSLTIGSVYGYTLGSLYVWMLTAVEIYRLFDCDTTLKGRVLIIFNGLPSLACLIYLSVSIPIRMIKAFRKGRYFVWADSCEETMTLQDIQASYAGLHVTQLFKKPVIKPPSERKTKKDRILAILMSLFHRIIYQNKRGFRYPARMIAVMIVSIMVIYSIMFQIVSIFPPLFARVRDAMDKAISDTYTIAQQSSVNESQITATIESLTLLRWTLEVSRISIIMGGLVAFVFTVINVLHTLSNYRANLLDMYKGDCPRIPPASSSSNSSLCISSIKYAGFQVGYLIWSYTIQFLILTLVAFALALVFTLIANGHTDWLVQLLKLMGPIILIAVLIIIAETLLAKYVFLQERGRFLALDNRSLYFNFTYFMFFYNIFIGLASCLMRILKSMVIGIIFLSRLDHSTMPRRFEFIDPGFKAYLGYMHIEATHTHPVILVFARLMLLGVQKQANRRQEQLSKDANNGSGSMELGMDSMHDKEDLEDASKVQPRRSTNARLKWHVAYTLLHNPDIRMMRAGFLQVLQQAKQLGVYVPISDQPADVKVEDLLEKIADAKEKLKRSSKATDDDDLIEVTVDDAVRDSEVTFQGASLISETKKTGEKAKLISEDKDLAV